MEGAHGNDMELISKTLQVEHKIFYFDLKKNPSGWYLKISEKASGSRSTIIVPASGIRTFVDLFQYYVSGETPLESSEVQVNTKVFYFDVGDNQRGRFLKVSEVTRNRSTIIVPAGNGDGEGWASFRDILAVINEGLHSLAPEENTSADFQEPSSEHISHLVGKSQKAAFRSSVEEGAASVGHESSGALSKSIRVEQKKFYFDLGSNARGQYLRISEVTGSDRSAIILPVSALEQFYETVGQFVETVRNQELPEAGSSRMRPGASGGAAIRSWSEG
ncbi:hypothetical protein GOP47_0023316 [Adiantum capillus-veneris]|uniref:Transcription factor Pur-alpha 1 n=1 Tax=Adiantum capillus-veneris TaxID=13818 RepID=A0A9D4U7L6_ADICA|nr:hypothetical protein GOP47_0023026 [Adiantum capillus-veneris]KAI5062777.1 hypothetical protein GOP47_0023316 [Adiantum capillus-veneris]